LVTPLIDYKNNETMQIIESLKEDLMKKNPKIINLSDFDDDLIFPKEKIEDDQKEDQN